MSAYNAEKSIEKAIKSVLNQTYKNIELIIIEDCSTDNTLNIIKSFNDPRITLIQHKNNLGAGYSRFDGIKSITGDYTTFLDSDDYLKEDCIETLINEALRTNADMVSPGYTAIYPNGEIEPKIPKQSYVLTKEKVYWIDPSDCLRFLNPALVKSDLWNKVEYSKRRFIEDSPTLIKLLYFTNIRAVLNYSGYYYVQNPNSLCHTKTTYDYYLNQIICSIDAFEFFKKHCVYRCWALLRKIENIVITNNIFDNNKDCYIEDLKYIENFLKLNDELFIKYIYKK